MDIFAYVIGHYLYPGLGLVALIAMFLGSLGVFDSYLQSTRKR